MTASSDEPILDSRDKPIATIDPTPLRQQVLLWIVILLPLVVAVILALGVWGRGMAG